MTKYAVYQLPFEHPCHRELSFMTPYEIEQISDEYEFVAIIDAKTLDECFRIGNFVVEEDDQFIEMVGEMHSISVGDIIHNLETDHTHVVESYGFGGIIMKESV